MPLITNLPLDLYGTSNTNRVVGEEHTVDSLATNIFALERGPFYSHPSKLTVYSVTLQRNLTPSVDFVCLQHYQELTEKTGHEVMCAIMITNTEAYGIIRVTAQMVGGPYQNIVEPLLDAIAALEVDNRPVNWGDLIGVPDAFVPADHLHHIDDTYGWEYLADATNNIADVILVGSQATLMEVLETFTTMYNNMMDAVNNVMTHINGHEEATGNVHQLTKAQFGIDQLPNYPASTKAISEARTSDAHLMTPLQVSYLLDVHPNTSGLANHLAASNPHNITKNTVGLSELFNYAPATLTDFNNSATDKYVVVNLLKQVDDNSRTFTGNSITAAMNNHLASSNPHGITKNTIGLSNVVNYAIGTITDFNNAAGDKYVITSLLKQVDDSTRTFATNAANSALTGHLNTTNPHGITKDTVGLSEVINYGIASLTDVSNAATNKYVVASVLKSIDDSTRSWVTSGINTSMSSHLAASNPHNITKTTVGLTLVRNYDIANLTDFNNAVSDKYVVASLLKTVDVDTRAWAVDHVDTKMIAHLAASNPHGITKNTIGLNLVPNFAMATDLQTVQATRTDLFTSPASVNAAIQANAPIKTFQGRTAQNAALQFSDRDSLGLGEGQSPRFLTVMVGNSGVVSPGSRRTTLVSSLSNPAHYGRNSHIEDVVDNDIRKFYLPWSQQPSGSYVDLRLMATEWMNKPYIFGRQINLAANATSYTFSAFNKGYEVINVTDTASTLLTIRPEGNDQLLPGLMTDNPDSTRDKARTTLEDGTNQWFFSKILVVNPRNRTIQWDNFIWGEAGAPELTPNSDNYILLTMALIRNPSDGNHYYSGWRAFSISSGFA